MYINISLLRLFILNVKQIIYVVPRFPSEIRNPNISKVLLALRMLNITIEVNNYPLVLLKRVFSKIPSHDSHLEPKPHLSYIPVFLHTCSVKETLKLHWEVSLGLSSHATDACACVSWILYILKQRLLFFLSENKTSSYMHLKKWKPYLPLFSK